MKGRQWSQEAPLGGTGQHESVQTSVPGAPVPAGPRTRQTRPCPGKFCKQPCVLPLCFRTRDSSGLQGSREDPMGSSQERTGLGAHERAFAWPGGGASNNPRALHLPALFTHRAPRLPVTWKSAAPVDQSLRPNPEAVGIRRWFRASSGDGEGHPLRPHPAAVGGNPPPTLGAAGEACSQVQLGLRCPAQLPLSPGPQQGTTGPGKAPPRPGVSQLCPTTSWWLPH